MIDGVLGIILVGGRAKRLGGLDKSKLKIGQRSNLERATMTLSRSLNKVALSAPNSAQVYNPLSFDIIRDLDIASAQGSTALAVLSCLSAAKSRGFHHIISTTVDTPFLPINYVEQLLKASAHVNEIKKPVVCESGGRVHGLHALWPVACFEDLKRIILSEDVLKLEMIHQKLGSVKVVFGLNDVDPFLNINTPEDLRLAECISNLD